MTDIINMVNISGGKDSTATYLVALETVPHESIRPVFADTGNEHPMTYEYVDYLQDRLGIPIKRVRADFHDRIMAKRERLPEKWAKAGVPQGRIDRAMELLHPTGNPFLDMCLWRAGFPSMRRRFCTDELKRQPINRYMGELLDDADWLWNWIGVRGEESVRRHKLLDGCPKISEDAADDILIYRPILKWTAQSVFEAMDHYGVESNPLYRMGMSRVGCMPCVNCNKGELRQIASRFPEETDRIREWENLVNSCSRTGVATFLPAVKNQSTVGMTHQQIFDAGKIDTQIRWAKTSRGGRQQDIESMVAPPSCSSFYGLCE